jgi:hypothetical protein
MGANLKLFTLSVAWNINQGDMDFKLVEKKNMLKYGKSVLDWKFLAFFYFKK